MMVWPFPRRIAEEKQHPTGAAFMVGESVKWDGGHNRRTYISEGYQHNVIVYRAIREVVEATKAIKVELFQGDELLTDHPALDLLDRPNPWQAYEEWLSEMMVNRLLFGETFCVGTPEGQFAELWPLNPIDMEVKPGIHGLPRAYCHRKGKSEQYFKVDQVTGESEVFYLKTYNPDNYWRGQSPLMAASLSADTHNAGSRWNYSLLKNSARPSGLVRFKGGYPAGEAIQRMREYFKAALSGERNAGEIPMLADDAEFVELSKSPMDMDFSNTMKEMAKYIASAFGVPLPLIDNDASTFNNLEQAKERLYTDTAIPIMSEFMGGPVVLAPAEIWRGFALQAGSGQHLSARRQSAEDVRPSRPGVRERRSNARGKPDHDGLPSRRRGRVYAAPGTRDGAEGSRDQGVVQAARRRRQ
jgi:HK97 family phage portal protein